MFSLPFTAWITIGVTIGIFLVMQLRIPIPTDILFTSGLVIVVLCGALEPRQALAGFANPAVITIAALFVVASGLQATGLLDWAVYQLLGSAGSAREALLRLAPTLLFVSAFVNNTPVVAMFVPAVLLWCRQRGISPSKLLMPVSFLAILGGTCSLIGTSTNIVVNGLIVEAGLRPMHLFEIGYVGLPVAIVGALFLLTVGYHLLPNRTDLVERLEKEAREYLVEMIVEPGCRLAGKTVEEAGLRHLRGLFLIEIDRDGHIITPVTPEDIIHEGDRLVFTGVVTTIVDLVKIPGLRPAGELRFRLDPRSQRGRHLCEAVVSRSSPLIGQTIREANFRRMYNAVVIAVHRNGERLPRKIGDIELQPGDTLLLQTRTDFTARFRHSRDFYLVASVEGSEPPRHERAWIAGLLLGGFVLWLLLRNVEQIRAWLPAIGEPAVGAVFVALAMVLTRCVSPGQARNSIDLQVLITIGAAVGLGKALESTKAADAISQILVQGVSGHPYLLLGILFVLGSLLTEFITNVAVAAMILPIALSAADAGGYDPRPFIMAITMAASMSFLTPVGYQTNLMVMGPGGYQPRDYLKLGILMNLIVAVCVLTLIPWIWPFYPPTR